MCIPLHPQYLAEVSPKKLRGFASSTASLFLSLGKVLGQVLGQREFLGNAALWPLLMAFSGLAALVQLLTLPFFPESPPHLLLDKGDEEGCLKAMRTLWGDGPHQAELEDLRKEQAATPSSRGRSVLELLREPSLRWQLYMLITVVVTMQLSGVQAIYFYMFEVLQTAGFDPSEIPYLSLGVSLSELLSAILCSFLIERVGRRVLLWGGYGLMATVLAAVTLTLSLQAWFSWMSYCSLALIFCFVICFGMGPAGATTSVRVEIFDQSSRPPSFVISSVLNWVGVFVIGIVFPFIVESLRQFSFLVFMGTLYLAGFLIYFFLPETKEKSILEIKEEFDILNFKKKKHLTSETNHAEGGTFCTKF
ncbi:solute carrier family 2, facilitated glucose transporter member 11-like, partial [Varanus komodoensis]|uniref:solute carrier family 2, facilitated glucose transporter member 11-like n=1 Tax=Varanus komodoensis TaxID=61221 RepID=UPI001CF7686C